MRNLIASNATPTLSLVFNSIRRCANAGQINQHQVNGKWPVVVPGAGRRYPGLIRDALATNPMSLESPFEGVSSIAGGVWMPDDGGDDALLLLRFERGTLNLPLHAHEHSDRLIVVLNGSGWYEWLDRDGDGESSERPDRIQVNAGDMLRFDRGVVHTFSTPEDSMLLLSHHRPFIPLDDPRQYTVANDNRAGVRANTWNT